jgi:predicted RNA methylase
MEELLTQDEAAEYLGISTASIPNWIRHGYLIRHGSLFNKAELAAAKRRVESGEIDRLNSRANKSRAKDRFIPDECVSSTDSLAKIQEITFYISSNHINIDQALFLLAINLFRRAGDISTNDVDEIFEFSRSSYKRTGVYEHIAEWLGVISSGSVSHQNEKVTYLLGFDLPDENDVIGIIYQSIIHAGVKSGLGSYYTPLSVVESMVDGNVRKDYTVLDPCCGTGQFLLSFCRRIEEPSNIFGFDIDDRAVRIARTNLLLHYTESDFSPNVFALNALLIGRSDHLHDDSVDYRSRFDFIATNPPWGAKYDKKTLSDIRDNFAEIRSKESFSFFICQSYRLLKDGGAMNLVLPESITNVRTHSDIRSYITSKLEIQYIRMLGKCFTKVFSSVITMHMRKAVAESSSISVSDKDEIYAVEQSRFRSNKHLSFDIHVSEKDSAIVSKMTDREFVTLEGNAEWALGIVTGDNRRFVVRDSREAEWELIYKGSDVGPFALHESNNYIHFTPAKYQQVAPLRRYRAPEKLIYKFISRDLIFAYDDRQSLTLNSANIVIPQIAGYPIKAVLGFLNSQLANFYSRKKFNSIKILRGNLEQLPIPVVSDSDKKQICELVDGIIDRRYRPETLDVFWFDYYQLDNSERTYVLSCCEEA